MNPAAEMPRPPDRCHIAGIAGVGMSALAEAMLDRGYRVTGSDRFLDQGRALDVLRTLEAAGVRLVPQDGSGLDAQTSALIVSTAVEQDNPDLAAARRLGIPILHRARMLSSLVGGARSVAVSGTCGKTTITGMCGWILERLGLDPTVINGGAVVNWMTDRRLGSTRLGASDWCVFEADESDRSFLNFHPSWAVVSNISKDHFELDEVVSLFRRFAAQVRDGIVAGPGVSEILAGAATCPVYEIPAGFEPRPADGGWAFEVAGTEYLVPLRGRHNAENARLAVELSLRLGLAPADLRTALAGFRGIHRRLEEVGRARGVTVLDDYAHNPQKLAAAWAAAAEAGGRVVGVWRPHGFKPLTLMMEELAKAFAGALRPGDRLFLLPVFYAGGTASGQATSDDLAARCRSLGAAAEAVPGYAELEAALAGQLRAGDTLLVMGARDPELPAFARRMARQWAAST